MGEFNGVLDFAVGSVKGARSFDVDAHGRLIGVSYPAVWTPGENVAKCYATANPTTITIGGSAYSFSGIWVGKRPLPPENLKAHSMVDCNHGYYGYYDGSNDFHTKDRISGIVEGYGEALIGTRGFRTSKAKILALTIPKKRRPFPWPLRQWFHDHDGAAEPLGALLGGTAIFSTIFTLVNLIGLLINARGASTLAAVGVPIMLISIALFMGAVTGTFYTDDDDEKGLSPDTLEKLRRNYPDVPIFPTFKKMVKAFPPDTGLEPSPETDPKFWQRQV